MTCNMPQVVPILLISNSAQNWTSQLNWIGGGLGSWIMVLQPQQVVTDFTTLHPKYVGLVQRQQALNEHCDYSILVICEGFDK